MAVVPVGLIQMSCTSDKQANTQKAMELTRQAAVQGAKIVCLQELYASLYFCDTEDYEHFALADAIPGEVTDAWGKLAAELNVVIIASLFEKIFPPENTHSSEEPCKKFLSKLGVVLDTLKKQALYQK